MTTVRQIERLWKDKEYDRLFAELTAARPEGALRLRMDVSQPLPAAAIALIRLDELNQGHVPLYGSILRTVLSAQDADGGWGDLITTAFCLRALLCSNGNGLAVDRGLEYVAQLQKTEGLWPNVPIRRMPADAYVSALVLYELGDQPRFREGVRFAETLEWFTAHEGELEDDCRQLWDRVRVRCRWSVRAAEPTLSFS
jgi:hypothetical protein